jgi:hypothetical protein
MSGSEPQVRWDHGGNPMALYTRGASARQPERITAWIVISLVFATTTLAMFDLYLLLAGLR